MSENTQKPKNRLKNHKNKGFIFVGKNIILTLYSHCAPVVKLVDAPDSKSGTERCVGSSPTRGTIFPKKPYSETAEELRRGMRYRGALGSNDRLRHARNDRRASGMMSESAPYGARTAHVNTLAHSGSAAPFHASQGAFMTGSVKENRAAWAAPVVRQTPC